MDKTFKQLKMLFLLRRSYTQMAKVLSENITRLSSTSDIQRTSKELLLASFIERTLVFIYLSLVIAMIWSGALFFKASFLTGALLIAGGGLLGVLTPLNLQDFEFTASSISSYLNLLSYRIRKKYLEICIGRLDKKISRQHSRSSSLSLDMMEAAACESPHELEELVGTILDSNINIDVNDCTMSRKTLFHFCLKNDLDKAVSRLLDAGFQINENIFNSYDPFVSSNLTTPLLLAVQHASNKVVDVLIQRGAAIDQKGPGGNTPLMAAARLGLNELISTLISNQANLDEKNNEFCTALMIAARRPNSQVLEKLIEAGAALDEKDGYGSTALITAVCDDNFENANCLIKAGASLDIEDRFEKRALRYAVRERNSKLVNLLIQSNATVRLETLSLSIIFGNDRESALLIDKLDSCPAPSFYGEIVRLANEKTIKSFLPHRNFANLINYKREDDGATALIILATRGCAEVVQALINKGANVNEKNSRGETALMVAVAVGHVTTAKTIVQAKKNSLFAVNNDGENALFYPAKLVCHKPFEFLLESGIDPNTKNFSGVSILDLLKEKDYRSIEAQPLIVLVKKYQQQLLELYSLLSRHRGDTPFTPTANDLNLTDKTLFHNYSQLANVSLETEQQEPFTSLQTQEIEPITRPDHPSLARSLLCLLKKNNHKVAIEKARCKTHGCAQVFLDTSGRDMDLPTLLRFSQALGKEPKDFNLAQKT